jgi:hypothetical protein
MAMILNIHNFNGQSLISHQSVYSPELIHLLRQFFVAQEQRNEKMKQLLEKLQQETNSNNRHILFEELWYQSQETELDIEIVKKLLP